MIWLEEYNSLDATVQKKSNWQLQKKQQKAYKAACYYHEAKEYAIPSKLNA